MKYHTKTAGIVLALALAGCSATGSGNPTNDVYATVNALTAADKIAAEYIKLPLCGPTHPKPVCSEAKVSAQVKAAEQTAYDAVKAAEANTSLLPAAKAAVADLENVTPKVGG